MTLNKTKTVVYFIHFQSTTLSFILNIYRTIQLLVLRVKYTYETVLSILDALKMDTKH